MKYLCSLFLILSFITAKAQIEKPMQSTPIDRSESPIIPLPGSNSTPSKNPFIGRTTPTSENYQQPEKEPLSMKTGHDLLTAGDFIEKKWTEDEKARTNKPTDQYLGDYITTGKFVEIYCRDYQYVDGDRVRVYVNGKMIQTSIELQAHYKPVLVTLEDGFNTIEFEALNQGESGPNTAAMKVIGDQGELITSSQWNLLTGAKARIIVVKN
ncbi:hypothetical protein L1I30_07680 [Gillisia sp. M10.2A]|uniref:Secreted protein n=1 Tax=Gillisia lutea TaxID=2909668 RepID=A0ABS9EF97_9FLAO|nr:hypothetical protein [Gillisia lutea]MCF4101541.1 hypothetical protein [Gillisia lutea]